MDTRAPHDTLLTAPEPPADLILVNGTVVTVDPRDTVCRAMAVRGERVARVGSDAEVLALSGPATEVVDLEGRAVLPGLIDSHVHAPAASMTEFDHPIPEMRCVGDVLAYVRQRADALPEGQWILLSQVFITRLEEQRYPTRAELDAAAPGHPAMFRTGPDASLSTRAMRELGITRERQAPAGSKIERDAAGEPTGILRGWSKIASLPPVPSRAATPDDRYARLLALLRDYASVGITSIADRGATPESVALCEKMLARNDLPVRVSLSRSVANTGSVEDVTRQMDAIAAEPLRHGGPMLKIVGVKMFLDGGMLTGSAYLREPWGVSDVYGIDDPEYRGLLFIEPERLRPIVRASIERGLQFTAHTVGDGAVHALVDAYAEAARDRSIRETRPCISHCNFMSREAIAEMARLGVVADLQPAWLYLDTRTLSGHFGYDRLRWFQPLRSCFEAGVVVGGGSDHMQKIGSLRANNFYNPFLAMWTAVTRRADGCEGRLHPEEALTRMQAIRFYTANNAYLLFQEQETGSLEPEKLADLVVLDRDILACSEEEVREIQVERTYLGGRQTHP